MIHGKSINNTNKNEVNTTNIVVFSQKTMDILYTIRMNRSLAGKTEMKLLVWRFRHAHPTSPDSTYMMLFVLVLPWPEDMETVENTPEMVTMT